LEEKERLIRLPLASTSQKKRCFEGAARHK